MINEPKFVFLTAFRTTGFVAHLKELEITELHEKPISFELLNVIVNGLEVKERQNDNETH